MDFYRVLFGLALALNLTIVGRYRGRAQAGRKFSYETEGRLLFLLLRGSALLVIFYCGAYLIRPASVSWSLIELPAWPRLAAAAALFGPVPGFIAWTQRHLGANVSPTVTTFEGQTLVTTGPYRWIRNPLYTAGTVLWSCAAVLSASWILALAAVLAIVLIRIRLPKEEAELEARFGEAWRAYRRGTGRFLPRWRRP